MKQQIKNKKDPFPPSSVKAAAEVTDLTALVFRKRCEAYLIQSMATLQFQ